MNQIGVWELVALDSSAFGSPCSVYRYAGWKPGWSWASLPHKASSALSIWGGKRGVRGWGDLLSACAEGTVKTACDWLIGNLFILLFFVF